MPRLTPDELKDRYEVPEGLRINSRWKPQGRRGFCYVCGEYTGYQLILTSQKRATEIVGSLWACCAYAACEKRRAKRDESDEG